MGGKRCAIFRFGASMRVKFANKGAFAFFTGLSSDADVSEGRFAAAVAAAVALSPDFVFVHATLYALPAFEQTRRRFFTTMFRPRYWIAPDVSRRQKLTWANAETLIRSMLCA